MSFFNVYPSYKAIYQNEPDEKKKICLNLQMRRMIMRVIFLLTASISTVVLYRG